MHARARGLVSSVEFLLFMGFLIAAPAQTRSSGAPSDWRTANGDENSDHYAPLAQITKRNVARLRERCTYDLGETVQFQDAPIVASGVMYIATFENTYAIDGRTCRLIWRVHRTLPSIPPFGSIRGLGYSDGRIYVATLDGHVIALQASNGRRLWDRRVLRTGSLAYFVAAPLAAEGLVFIGNAGSDLGAVGRMFALDARSGRVVWNVPLIPTGPVPGAASWRSRRTDVHLAGGGTWTAYSFDARRHLLYVPVGNPGPDFDGDYRPGANLYTDSVVALDATTGALRAWHQLVPHDTHDWDVSTPPALITNHGRTKQIAIVGKDGYLYQLDPQLRRILHRTPTTTMFNGNAPITPVGTRFCPGTQGGTEFNGVAYSPASRLLYTPSVDWCTTIKLARKTTFVAGKPFIGSQNGFGMLDPIARAHGWVTAVDAESGKARWKWRAPTPLLAAVTPTAGGLVFTGDLKGDFLAFDADSGTVLYQRRLPAPVSGGLVSYAVDGNQYVAVVAGFPGPIWHLPKTRDRVIVFGL
jgi:alcohol dehydrogenase (cytochrome c)